MLLLSIETIYSLLSDCASLNLQMQKNPFTTHENYVKKVLCSSYFFFTQEHRSFS